MEKHVLLEWQESHWTGLQKIVLPMMDVSEVTIHVNAMIFLLMGLL